MTTRSLPLIAALLAGVAAFAPAQTAEDRFEYEPPERLADFWEEYREAKGTSDEAKIDAVVEEQRDDALAVLEHILSLLSAGEILELHHDARTLGWSLERVDGDSRYIERVRLVLDLPQNDRRSRATALEMLDDARAIRAEAALTMDERDWEDALSTLDRAIARLEDLRDHELTVRALYDAAMVERARGRPWHAARYLARIGPVAEKLPFPEPIAENAEAILARLAEQGIDPDGPQPEEIEGFVDFGETLEARGSGGLTTFKAGTEDRVFPLERVVPRNPPSASLPCYVPFEQFLVWPTGWVDGDGPSEFDTVRGDSFQPFGEPLYLVRTSISQFGFDSDGDGVADVEFTGTTTPTLVEIPAPDGEGAAALLVATGGDRETQFGIDVNYSPQQSGALVRFAPGEQLEAEVDRDTWTIVDTNLSGTYGDAFETWGDRVTHWQDERPISYWELDSVVIGRAKRGVPWSSILPYDGGFHRARIDRDRDELVLRELDIDVGEVELDLDLKTQPDHLVVRETGRLGGAFFDVVPDRRGPVELPVGTYEIAMGVITKGAKTSMDVVRIYKGRSEPFEVVKGETTVLELGAPFTFDVQAENEGGEFVVDMRTLRVAGRGGEEYAMFFDDPPQPEVTVLDADGRTVEKGIRTLRPDISHWQDDAIGNVLWFPLDVRLENEDAEPWTVTLEQKSHKLLGGPFASRDGDD